MSRNLSGFCMNCSSLRVLITLTRFPTISGGIGDDVRCSAFCGGKPTDDDNRGNELFDCFGDLLEGGNQGPRTVQKMWGNCADLR